MMYIMIMIQNMLKFKRSDLGRILRISHRDIIHLSRFRSCTCVRDRNGGIKIVCL